MNNQESGKNTPFTKEMFEQLMASLKDPTGPNIFEFKESRKHEEIYKEHEEIYKNAGILEHKAYEKRNEIEQYMQEYRVNWKDYYKILQVDPSITQDDIYLIYKRVHESHNPIAEEAWETLSDPIKRVAYDRICKEKH